MPNPNNIKINFGLPESGWILMEFNSRDFQLKVNISNVPEDPMVELLDSLLQIIKGIKNPDIVCWHLEPFCYYLQLSQIGETFEAKILESDQYAGPMRPATLCKGSFEEIILPLYRGLKKFSALSYNEHAWRPIDQKRILELTALVKTRKL